MYDYSTPYGADLLDGLMQSFGDVGSMVGNALSIGLIGIAFALAFIVGTYLLYSYTVLYNARKAGLQDDWMAFVPFARTIYRLKTVGDPWWKMFLLGEWYIYLYVINRLIIWISKGSGGAGTFLFYFDVLYIAGVLTMHILYRRKYFSTFGFKPMLGILPLTFCPIFLVPIDCIIAFSDLFPYRAGGVAQAPVGGSGDTLVRVAAGTASITGLTGMFAGQDFPIAANEETVLGRDSGFSHIVIDQHADKVSRKHCSIWFDSAAGSYIVTDYSSNGTFIDGGSRLVANVPTPLSRGTVIALGSRENRFKLN